MPSLLKKLTFKRVIITFIIFSLTLPIYASLFGWEKAAQETNPGYEYEYLQGDKASENKILQISVSGVIYTESGGNSGPFSFLNEGGTYGYDIKEQFRRAAKNEAIKAVFLTINSPGGTIAGSQAISDGIELYRRQTGNPVYAHIRDVGASGGYWAASSTDKIFADSGSLIGSIGVIMGPFTYYDRPVQEGGLLDSVTTDNGIEHTYITGGEYKDTGSPYRRMTPEEKAHWQKSVDNEYTLFVNHVSQTRKIDPLVIRNTIKALPYDTTQAKELHLIDAVGSEDTALAALAVTAGVGDDYELFSEKTKIDFFSEIFSATSLLKQPKTASVCAFCNTPVYLYDRTYGMFE